MVRALSGKIWLVSFTFDDFSNEGGLNSGCLEDLKLFGENLALMSNANQMDAVGAAEKLFEKLESQT